MSDLDAYLDRIGYSGPVAPDLATLTALHRGHSMAIPYENIDVQLRRPLTIDPQAAFDKVVRRGRGGWCYEMNGTLWKVLTEIGFSVTRMAGGVMREAVGDAQIGNHLVLRVDLPEGPHIADVGFGDGPIEPYPLKAGPFEQRGFPYRLDEVEDGYWRLRNQPNGGAASFDFRAEKTDEALLAEKCAFLQESETSVFRMLLICQRHRPDGLRLLRGKVLRSVTPEGYTERTLESLTEFETVLAEEFGLSDPEAPRLWDMVCERHAQFFARPVEPVTAPPPAAGGS
jgi:N-hydroxyarylamine O-acetyltransferase